MSINLDIITFLKIITLAYIFSGVTSTIFDNPIFAYGVTDITLILCLFLSLKIKDINRTLFNTYIRSKSFGHIFFFFLLTFCIISFRHINEDSILKSLVGIREYLVPFLFIPFGIYLAKNLNNEQLIRSESFLTKIIYLLVLVIILQILKSNEFINFKFIEIFDPKSGSIHSWYDDSVNLYSSVFSSNKRAARFIFFSSIILIYIRKKLGLKSKLIIFISYLFIVSTGSREAVVMYTLFIIYELFILEKRANINPYSFLLKLITLAIILLSILNYSKKNYFLDYIYSVSNADSYFERIVNVYDSEILNYPIPISGYGPGSYGQISRFSNFYDQLHKSINFKRGFRDSYFAKLYFEFGVYSIILVVFIFLIILKIYFKKSKNDFHKISKFIFFSWLVFLIKGHPLSTDLYLSVFIAILIGSMMNYAEIKK